MKTAISVPDGIYERAERVARRHGMNRSQFYAAAAHRLADELESEELTAAIDAAVEAIDADESVRFATDAGVRLLAGADDTW